MHRSQLHLCFSLLSVVFLSAISPRAFALDFGDAPDSIAGTSPKGVFDIGTDFRISTVLPESVYWSTSDPAIAYDPNLNQYLVVYVAPISVDGSQRAANEVFGALVDASTGAVITNHFRISTTLPDNHYNYDADQPAVAYDAVNTQYLVVWDSDHNLNGKNQIHGQRVDADGNVARCQFPNRFFNLEAPASMPSTRWSPSAA